MTPPPTPTPSAQSSPHSLPHHFWQSTSHSLPSTIIILPSPVIMSQILCVYPSSHGAYDWSIDSVSSASIIHSLPFETPSTTRNPFEPHSFTPRHTFPRSHRSKASSPFKPMDTLHVIDNCGFQVPQSVILRVHGSHRDSQGHTLHFVDISHPTTMEFRIVTPREIYCRRSRNSVIVYCRRTWQRFRDFIGW